MKSLALILTLFALNSTAAHAYDLTCSTSDGSLRLVQQLFFGGAPPPDELVRPHWYVAGKEIKGLQVFIDYASQKILAKSEIAKYYDEVIYSVPVQVQMEGPSVPGFQYMICRTYEYSGPPVP